MVRPVRRRPVTRKGGGGGGYLIPDPDMIPRASFRETMVGCEMHGDPDCLCDVKITVPATVAATDIVYGDLASQLVGPPTAHNFVDWAAIVLGCTDAVPVLNEATPTTRQGNGHTGKLTAWAALDDSIRDKMREAYKARIPWSQAKQFLPETLSPEDRKKIASYYNQRAYAKPKRKEKQCV